MLKKSLITLLLMAAVSHAAVKELIPNLKSNDLNVQTQARLDLMAACSEASTPEAGEAARKAICLEICDVLRGNYPTAEVVQPMLNNLERIGGEESVPTLTKLMNHKDEHIRDDARRALAVNPSSAAAQALGAQLKNRRARSPETTAGLIYALGERKQVGASRMIVGALKNSNQEIFIAAVKTLGRLNEDVGVQALSSALAKESGFRKIQIEAALLATGRNDVLSGLYRSAEDAEIKASALTALILAGDTAKANGAMASGDAVLQVAVIEAAVQGKDKAVYDAVAKNIGSLAPYVQVQAVAALEFSGNTAYAKSIEPLLKSNDTFMQDNVSRALARIGTADSVSPLMANGRSDARRALGQLNVKGVDDELEKLAASGDPASRSTAIEALANRGRRDLIPTFFNYAGEADRGVASSAAMAISSIGDDSNISAMADLMIAKETAPVSRDMLNGIVKIMRVSPDQPSVVQTLVTKMNGASPRSQANILKVLAESGSTAALKPLADACRSSDEQLQKTAVKALGGWKEENGIPVMLEVAADESVSLTNHVILMRGVSRLYAGNRRPNKADVQEAIDTCRRQEEKDGFEATLKKAK